MTTSDIRVRGTAEMIATLPLQLGYRPEESLVLVLLGELDGGSASARPAGRVKLMCRVDLPQGIGDFEEVLASIHHVLRQHRPAVVQAVAFEDDQDATAVLQAVERLCRSEDVLVDQLGRVRGNRWLALLENIGMEPGVWADLPSMDAVPAAAELVWQGAATGPSRDELDAVVRGSDRARQEILTAEIAAYLGRLAAALPLEAVHGLSLDAGPDLSFDAGPDLSFDVGLDLMDPVLARFLDRAARAWRRLLDPTPEGPGVADLPPAEIAQALVLLWHRGFRDALIAWVAPGQLGPGMLPAEVLTAFVKHLPVSRWRDRAGLDRLVQLCGLVADECAAPVLTVTSQVAWASNQGTLANLAIARALESEPDYTLAQLTNQLLIHAIPPPPGPFTAVD